jgi:hypothetical protein
MIGSMYSGTFVGVGEGVSVGEGVGEEVGVGEDVGVGVSSDAVSEELSLPESAAEAESSFCDCDCADVAEEETSLFVLPQADPSINEMDRISSTSFPLLEIPMFLPFLLFITYSIAHLKDRNVAIV